MLHHYFTFGPDQHPVRNAYVMVSGCDDEQARAIMVALYGTDWSMQYSGAYGHERFGAMMTRHEMTQVRHIRAGETGSERLDRHQTPLTLLGALYIELTRRRAAALSYLDDHPGDTEAHAVAATYGAVLDWLDEQP